MNDASKGSRARPPSSGRYERAKALHREVRPVRSMKKRESMPGLAAVMRTGARNVYFGFVSSRVRIPVRVLPARNTRQPSEVARRASRRGRSDYDGVVAHRVRLIVFGALFLA